MNYAKTALLLAALTGFFLVAGYLLGGQSGLLLALVAALGMNLFAYWNSDKMVLRMSNAHEVGPNDAPALRSDVFEGGHVDRHFSSHVRRVVRVLLGRCRLATARLVGLE